ncbi:MAG: hypothetical protein K2O84_05480 [Oscillospiraceae bacterium]|nr:hypothetical protein [Oscillospiraceae bacterium]
METLNIGSMRMKSILEMDGGAFMEIADYGMAKILDDIMDPNTQATSQRTLTMTYKFTPNEQRTKVGVECTSKLGFGKMLPLETTLHALVDRSTGEMCMVEATPQIPGQMGFDGAEQERPVQLKIIRTA